MHRKGKRRHDQHGPCRLSRYLSCSCFRLRLGCDTIFCFCRASWRAAYSSAESLVKRVCACLASIHRSGEYLLPNTCSNFSLAATSYPGRMACRASYSSTGSRSAACDFASASHAVWIPDQRNISAPARPIFEGWIPARRCLCGRFRPRRPRHSQTAATTAPFQSAVPLNLLSARQLSLIHI
mgnify:CR=1 FL=1